MKPGRLQHRRPHKRIPTVLAKEVSLPLLIMRTVDFHAAPFLLVLWLQLL